MRPPHDRAVRWLLVARGASLLTGCEFDGAYDLPLPGSPVDEDDAFEVTAEFARRAQRRARARR